MAAGMRPAGEGYPGSPGSDALCGQVCLSSTCNTSSLPPSPSHMAGPSSCLSSPCPASVVCGCGVPLPPIWSGGPGEPVRHGALRRTVAEGFAHGVGSVLLMYPWAPGGACAHLFRLASVSGSGAGETGLPHVTKGDGGVGPRAQWLRGHPGGCTGSRRSVLRGRDVGCHWWGLVPTWRGGCGTLGLRGNLLNGWMDG